MNALPVRLPPKRSIPGLRRWLKPLLVLAVAGLALSGCEYYNDDGAYVGEPSPYYGQPNYVTPWPGGYIGPNAWLGHDWRGDDIRGDRGDAFRADRGDEFRGDRGDEFRGNELDEDDER